ncbi:hypothetical protein [Micromonospora sp. NPDC047740]
MAPWCDVVQLAAHRLNAIVTADLDKITRHNAGTSDADKDCQPL